MELENKQQLELIAQTIKMAQRRFHNDSPYYILWGTAVFIASILQYILLQFDSDYNAIGWAICIPAAILIQLILLRKQKQTEKVKTHVESLLNTMWTAFGITLFVVLSFSSKLGANTFPIILCLYALSTFIAGSAFKIKAFMVGAVACWGLAIACFFVEMDLQLVLLAAGVLLAYIVPGIILRSSEQNATTNT